MKLKRAKIYIQENQIQLINSHEIYHLHFLKERQHAGETREPKTTYKRIFRVDLEPAVNIYDGARGNAC